MRRNNVTVMFVLLSFILITFLLFSTDYQENRPKEPARKFYPKINESFAEFDKCFQGESVKLKGDMEKMWVQIDKVISACDGAFTSYIKVEDYRNRDEVKRHVTPFKRTGKDVIVTLGIGRDTEAEKRLQKALGANNVEFFGADPIPHQNKELYSKLGAYFPYAVGARSGESNASVLEGMGYHEKVVVYMNIIEFLNQHVKRNFIDNLLLDVEYAEYDMLPFFYRGGQFDHEGITFCQVNAEIHSPSLEQKRKLKEFIFRIHEEKKYAMLKSVNVGHLRLYMVNMEDERCIEKYILRI